MTRPTASTTTPTCSASHPSFSSGTCSAAATISALAVGDPTIIAGSETYRIRGDASQIGQDEALPPGTRGGRSWHSTRSRSTASTSSRSSCSRINLGSIRGLEYEHQLEVIVDGERVLLAPVGGPDDYTQSSLNATNVVNSLAERLQVRVKVFILARYREKRRGHAARLCAETWGGA